MAEETSRFDSSQAPFCSNSKKPSKTRARNWYEKSRKVWQELEQRGILRGSDRTNLDAVDRALERLQESGPE